MKTPTHIEFQHVDGTVHVAPRDGIYLMHSPGDKEWLVYEADGDCCDISSETAARLRRELLGEGEPEPTCRHEWDADGERCTHCGDKDWMGSVPSAPPPEPAPPVVTGPGVYRDERGCGWRIGGRDKGSWYGEAPDWKRSVRRFGDDGSSDEWPKNRLTERVADVEVWNLPHACACTAGQLAAMLAAPVPAAEPEFVPVGWHVLAMDGVVLSAEPFATRVAAEEASAMWGQCRVVKLYVRREDARP